MHTSSYDLSSKGYARHYSLLKLEAFALPPLEEQKEIVKVVETLFKEVEQLEELTVERIALKEDFVTSALNQLTTKNANQEWTFLQDHFRSFFNETSNIKKLREDKGLRQKEVANALDIGYSNYNKIENGNREISVKELQRLSEFYNITVDQVINLNDGLPKEVIIEDKQANEQLRLISELDTDDRAIIFKMIDKMLTSKKFKDFFSKNVASL